MASWSKTTKHEPSEINGGNKYTLGDQVPIEQLNSITENTFYAIEHIDDEVKKLASADASNLTDENVEGWKEKLGLNDLTPLWSGAMSAKGTVTLNALLSNYNLVYMEARTSGKDYILQAFLATRAISGNSCQIMANNSSNNRYIKFTGIQSIGPQTTTLTITDIESLILTGVYVQ